MAAEHKSGLSEAEYAKYCHPAFPFLGKRAETAGLDREAVMIGFVIGWTLYQILMAVIVSLLTGMALMLLIDFFLRKDPEYLRLAPKVRKIKRFHSPWYRYDSRCSKAPVKAIRFVDARKQQA